MKLGDRVTLKSGHTVMTVVALRKHSRIGCVWFDERDRMHRASLPREALEQVPPPRPIQNWDAYADIDADERADEA